MVMWMPSSKEEEETEAEEEKEGGKGGAVTGMSLLLVVVVVVVVAMLLFVNMLVEVVDAIADSERECCKLAGERGGLEGGGERIDDGEGEEEEEEDEEEEEKRSGVSVVDRVNSENRGVAATK